MPVSRQIIVNLVLPPKCQTLGHKWQEWYCFPSILDMNYIIQEIESEKVSMSEFILAQNSKKCHKNKFYKYVTPNWGQPEHVVNKVLPCQICQIYLY